MVHGADWAGRPQHLESVLRGHLHVLETLRKFLERCGGLDSSPRWIHFLWKIRFILWKKRYLPGKIRWMPPETQICEKSGTPPFSLPSAWSTPSISDNHNFYGPKIRTEHRQFDCARESSSVFELFRCVVFEKSGTLLKRVVFYWKKWFFIEKNGLDTHTMLYLYVRCWQPHTT